MCLPKEEGGLGFRDLKAFNLALLAKQGWRLPTSTKTLVYNVFNACYFPHRDFLTAELGNGPFAWRSIMTAQNFVLHGHRWQVRNDLSIDIMKDKWNYQPSSFKHIASQPICQWEYKLICS